METNNEKNNAGIEARNVAGALTSMRIDELISNLAIGIADGQLALDETSINLAKFMSDAQVEFGKKAGSEEPDLISLIELGFTPNFYQFVDTILEVRVAISTKYEETSEISTSDIQAQRDERDQQTQYESNRNSASSGYSAGYGYGYRYGYYGYGIRYGSNAYSNSASSNYSSSLSDKRTTIQATTVDAKYASTYNYSVEGASTIKTKIVPVPPPQVLEETLRAKLKERREFENRLRLTDEVLTILPTLSSDVGKIISDSNLLSNDAILVGDEKTLPNQIQGSIKALQGSHDQLTTDNWSVIPNSVAQRETSDNALVESLAKCDELIAFVKTETVPADVTLKASESADTYVKALKESLISDLESYQKTIQALYTKVSQTSEGQLLLGNQQSNNA